MFWQLCYCTEQAIMNIKLFADSIELLYFIKLVMHHHTQQFNSSHILQLHCASWKHKIAFLEMLTQEIAKKHLSFPTQVIQAHWPAFIKEHNINVLSKAIFALQLWVDTYGIRSMRVQKELIKKLISLSKMGRPEIDCSVVSIVISLLSHQKQKQCRAPLTILSQSQFNSHNNPTFLIGYQQSETMQEEIIQKQQETSQIDSYSPCSVLLAEVISGIRSCQKSSFLICLKIVNEITKQGLISKKEFLELQKEAIEIRQVIEHRKFGENPKDKKIDSQTSSMLQQLKHISLEQS